MKKTKIAIIGAGSAGLTAARLAAKFGVDVTLFEKHRIGGDCLYTGCVPSKSIISVARRVHEAQQLSSFGVKTTADIDYKKVRQHIASSIQHIHDHEDSREALEKVGVNVVEEAIEFTGSNTLKTASGQNYEFKKCIIATGSRPRTMDIEGLPQKHTLTSDTIWDLPTLPKSLIVVGGGPIGLELSQAMAMLGSRVTVVERSDKLLGRFDDELSDAIRKGLESTGVNVLYNAEITSVKSETKLKVKISSGGKSEMYEADKVLLAIGRETNLDGLNLQAAGVEADRAIKVDGALRTSNKSIYAAGDCTGPPFFTHLAGEQGATALTHAMFGMKRRVNWDALPWAFFTTPEAAHVGFSKKKLTEKGVTFTEEVLSYDEIDKAVAEHSPGSARVFLDKRRRILGATVVGENASELIAYYAQMMATGKKLDELAKPMQAYPTYAMALRKHASDVQVKAFTDTIWPKLLLKLRGY